MLVPLVPRTLDNLACVALILLHAGVVDHAHVVVHVKVEERPRLSPRPARSAPGSEQRHYTSIWLEHSTSNEEVSGSTICRRAERAKCPGRVG
jgi:hypothetical protein